MYTRKFNLPEEIEIIEYLDSQTFNGYYGKNDSQSIDQKCTFDILNLNSKCLVNFYEQGKKEVCINDFILSEYSKFIYQNKTSHNGKAILRNETYKEYDKIFGNTLEMLAYANIIEKIKKKKVRYFKITNINLIKKLANSEDACIAFICHYVWLLVKNDLQIVDLLFKMANDPYNKNLKNKFKLSTINWIKNNSNRDKDSSQISQKINNPLFYLFELKKYHSNKKTKIFNQGLNDLSYFRIHVRDKNKKSGLTRKENKNLIINENECNEESYSKIKKVILEANIFYCEELGISLKNVSEYSKKNECNDSLHVHHIWPQSFWDPEKKDQWIHKNMYENLIVLSPNEHYGIAHEKNTKYLNQENLNDILICQYEKIRLLQNKSIYSINKFYSLICLIKKVPENKALRENKNSEQLYRHIEDLLFQ